MATNALEIKKESEFIQACVSGDIEILTELLKKDDQLVNKAASDGSFPLMLAVEVGHGEVIELLLKNKADLEGHNQGQSALLFAALCEQWDIVRLFIDNGAKNLDATIAEGEEKGVTALWLAACFHQWNIIRLLIDKGAKNLDAISGEGYDRRKPALWFAAYVGQWDIVNLLIDKGAKNLDAISSEGDDRGKSALWFAAYYKQWDIVRLLINKGAKNLDAISDEGYDRGKSALWHAVYYQQWDIVRLLIDKGAKNLDAISGEGDDKGKSALWLAAQNKQWDIVRLLIDKGAKNLDATPVEGVHKGKSVLWLAANHEQWDIVRLLIKAETNLEAIPAEGDYQVTAFWLTALYRQWDLVRLFLETNVNLDVAPATGQLSAGLTALYFAVENNQWDIVSELLAKSAKPLPLRILKVLPQNMLEKYFKIDNSFTKINYSKAKNLATIFLQKSGAIDVPSFLDKVAKELLEQGSQFIDKIIKRISVSELEKELSAFLGRYPDFRKSGMTALHYLAQDNQVSLSTNETPQSQISEEIKVKDEKSCLELLVTAGADVNELTDDGKTSLMLAIISSNFSFAQEIINSKQKINLDIVDKDGKTAMHYAALEGNHQILKLLLVANAKRDIREPSTKCTPLMLAAKKKDSLSVELLLGHELRNEILKLEGKQALLQFIDVFVKSCSKLMPEFINNTMAFFAAQNISSLAAETLMPDILKKRISLDLKQMLVIIEELRKLKESGKEINSIDVEILIVKTSKEGSQILEQLKKNKIELEKARIASAYQAIRDHYYKLKEEVHDLYTGPAVSRQDELLQQFNCLKENVKKNIEERNKYELSKADSITKDKDRRVGAKENTSGSRLEKYDAVEMEMAATHSQAREEADRFLLAVRASRFQNYCDEDNSLEAKKIIEALKVIRDKYVAELQKLETHIEALQDLGESAAEALIAIKGESLIDRDNRKAKAKREKRELAAEKVAAASQAIGEAEKGSGSSEENNETKIEAERKSDMEKETRKIVFRKAMALEKKEREEKARLDAASDVAKRKKLADELALQQRASEKEDKVSKEYTPGYSGQRSKLPSSMTLDSQSNLLVRSDVLTEISKLENILSTDRKGWSLTKTEMLCSALRGGLGRIFELVIHDSVSKKVFNDLSPENLRHYLFKGERFLLKDETDCDNFINITLELIIQLKSWATKNETVVTEIDSTLFQKMIKEAQDMAEKYKKDKIDKDSKSEKDNPKKRKKKRDKLLEEIEKDDKSLKAYLEIKDTTTELSTLAIGYIKGRLGANSILLRDNHYGAYNNNKTVYEKLIEEGNRFRHVDDNGKKRLEKFEPYDARLFETAAPGDAKTEHKIHTKS